MLEEINIVPTTDHEMLYVAGMLIFAFIVVLGFVSLIVLAVLSWSKIKKD